jgi:hypothetical protein
MSNFITKHVISKIEEMVREKTTILKTDTDLYFNEVIIDKTDHGFIRKIDRINSRGVFNLGYGYPIGYGLLKIPKLLEIYDKLKNNEFFTYKKIEGKDHKIRIKKK